MLMLIRSRLLNLKIGGTAPELMEDFFVFVLAQGELGITSYNRYKYKSNTVVTDTTSISSVETEPWPHLAQISMSMVCSLPVLTQFSKRCEQN